MPATRIITLAPHLAELGFAAGAADHLVGTVDYSNHPPAALALPRVGDAFRVDVEAVAMLRPDLILGWPSGNSTGVLEHLRALGYRVVDLEPRTLDDIGRQIALVGELAGTRSVADEAAAGFAARLAELREAHRGVRPLRVFYQISSQPLMTVGERHFIGQAMTVCGGVNIFGDAGAPAFVVEPEAVIAAAPDVIIASQRNFDGATTLADEAELALWRRWRSVPAVATGHLYLIDPGLLSVPGPRLTAGIASLCRYLAAARGDQATVTVQPVGGPVSGPLGRGRQSTSAPPPALQARRAMTNSRSDSRLR